MYYIGFRYVLGTYICSTHFRNMRNLEIALRNLRIYCTSKLYCRHKSQPTLKL